jgi:hypothetical protein
MHPGWLRRSSLACRRVCALLAPCHPGASTALFAQVIFSRLLSNVAADETFGILSQTEKAHEYSQRVSVTLR